jgi:hypothetical protein
MRWPECSFLGPAGSSWWVPMGPEEISRLTTAYEQAIVDHLVGRNDAITEMIAKKIIEIEQTGVRDPADISALTIKELGVQ